MSICRDAFRLLCTKARRLRAGFCHGAKLTAGILLGRGWPMAGIGKCRVY